MTASMTYKVRKNSEPLETSGPGRICLTVLFYEGSWMVSGIAFLDYCNHETWGKWHQEVDGDVGAC